MSLLFEIARYVTMVYITVKIYWKWIHGFCSPSTAERPSRKYFLSDEDDYDEFYTRVPEDAVYIEEWTDDDGNKLCYVQYEGEEIVEHSNPFGTKARCPWLGVSDEETDIDLTHTFNRFLIPGNRIHLDLVQKLIHITENTRLVYIESGTLEVKKFPGDGILIEQDV